MKKSPDLLLREAEKKEHYQSLWEYFRSLAPIERHSFVKFSDCLTLEKINKSQFFTACGEKSTRIGFVAQGLFRVYYVSADGTEVIRNICGEGQPIGPYGAALNGDVADVYIEAMEDSIVLSVGFEDLEAFYKDDLAWATLGRRIVEQIYQFRERREYQLLTLSAEERYLAFLRDFPELEQRVTQATVASFIGINPASLSRIRTKLKNNRT